LADKPKSSRHNTQLWLNLRTTVQILAFIGFLALFLSAAPLIMRLDPLAVMAASISGRALIPFFAIALFMVVLSLAFGRAWCGWLCPLGTILDWFSLNSWKRKYDKLPEWVRSIKYVLLIAILTAAVFSNLTLMAFDPMTIMVRTFTVSIWPGLDAAINFIESLLNNIGPLQEGLARFDNFLRPALLPSEALSYRDGWFFGLIFAVIIALNLVSRRFWCRYICPLGAFYGIISKISLIRRRVGESCNRCKLCEDICPTGTIQRKKDCASDPGECIMCLKCMDTCPCGTSDFGPVHVPAALNSYDPGRRQLFLGLGAAAVLAVLFRFTPIGKRGNPRLIRPPGSTEDDMTSRCIRCGECVRVCPTAAIQPAQTESGAEAFWTPVLVPRNGFCQYSCNACGQACPVAAIPPLALRVKQTTPIGLAAIDRTRCLPWAQNTPCIVCEEMCPVPHKAIILDTVSVTNSNGEKVALQRPLVVSGRCIGCGLCEYKCPVSGEAAIRVAV
jgi:polyferredoxin